MRIFSMLKWFNNKGAKVIEITLKMKIDVENFRKFFLKKRGVVFFPIISLCNEKKIFNC